MKKILAVLLLWMPGLAWAEKPAANAADYTIAVHVQASRLISVCVSGTCGWSEQMDVVIDGKKYILAEGISRNDLLRTGDYKAEILKDETTRPYEYMRTYQFLMPDGKTRDYMVTGEEN